MSKRRLIILTEESDRNLLFASQAMKMNHSMTIRESLRLFSLHLQRQLGRPDALPSLVEAAKLLGGVKVTSRGKENE